MHEAYLCPLCRKNRSDFHIVYHLYQEIKKDPRSGRALYMADEYVTTLKRGGRADVHVRCATCGHVGRESSFINASNRLDA